MTETVLPADAASTRETPFRWRLAHRPDLRFGHAAGGVAGILVAAAIAAFVVEVTDDDATLPGVGFNLLLIAAALAAGYFVRGPVRSAAVAAMVFAIPQVWLFAIIGDGEGVDRGDFRVVLLLSVATYVLFYALTWTRGRAVLLGVALLLFTNWIVFEVADQSTPFGVDAAAQVQVGGLDEPQALLGNDDKMTETGVVELIMAAVLLGGAVLLDRRGRAGAATPLLVVGGIQAVSAAGILGADVEDAYAVGIFVALAGLAIGLAGSLGRRRGTSYVGAAILLIGAVVVVAQGTSDAASGQGTAVFGGFALIAAAVLLLIGVLTARATHEPIDGGEPAVETPPPPEPEPARVGAPAESTAEDSTSEAPASTPTAVPPTEPTPTEETPTADTAPTEPPSEAPPDDAGRSGPAPER
jgi:hypothetical protein